ncbi:MAG TPA: LCP family protein [Streptosporangiaceae bacterium]|nr:LCP family protein [Streptosporangiaceae bacterium]
MLVSAVVGGGYFYVNHVLSSIHRIPSIAALDAADQPAVPAGFRRSMTVLLTGSADVVAGQHGRGVLGSSTEPQDKSGLIALVHLNANRRGGAVVSIPPNAVVRIPRHGRMPLWEALSIGGPSLLIRTVERLTHVRIDHYSVLDFKGLTGIVGAMHGVFVRVPFAFTSEGHFFHMGINHLGPHNVLAYVRQAQVSEIGRVLLQSNLIRAILRKIARRNMFASPMIDFAVLHAVARALSLDSNFSNTEVEALAIRLGHLDGKDGTFVTAPTINGSPITGDSEPVFLNRRISGLLWRAIRHDAVAAFALRFPFTVTPIAPA